MTSWDRHPRVSVSRRPSVYCIFNSIKGKSIATQRSKPRFQHLFKVSNDGKNLVILQCFCFFWDNLRWRNQIPRNLPFPRRLQAGLSCCRVDWAGAGYICGRPKWRRVSSEASIRRAIWEDGRMGGRPGIGHSERVVRICGFYHVFLVRIAQTNLVLRFMCYKHTNCNHDHTINIIQLVGGFKHLLFFHNIWYMG